MDKRSWPWKKKSSDKLLTEKALASALGSSATATDVSSTQIYRDYLCCYDFEFDRSHLLPFHLSNF